MGELTILLMVEDGDYKVVHLLLLAVLVDRVGVLMDLLVVLVVLEGQQLKHLKVVRRDMEMLVEKDIIVADTL
jgi:hypothetical protein